MNIATAIKKFRESDLVREKELGNGISSFNFKSKAFKKGIWNEQTVKARGLFIDTISNKVIARSYDKFFAPGEANEPKHFADVAEELQYPAIAYKKYNGYLGIVSGGLDGSELFVASKSTNTGEFAERFQRILDSRISKNLQKALAWYLYTNNRSAIFEVIDPVEDPHIVKYNSENLILLDLVENQLKFKAASYSEVQWLGEILQVDFKEIEQLWYTPEEANAGMSEIFAENVDDEGVVIVDHNGHMVKIKTKWYKMWKHERTRLQYYRNHKNEVEHSNDTSDILYKWADSHEGNIIDYRNWLKGE